MFCGNCGKELKAEVAYCPFCGSKVANHNAAKAADVKNKIISAGASKADNAAAKAKKTADSMKKGWNGLIQAGMDYMSRK